MLATTGIIVAAMPPCSMQTAGNEPAKDGARPPLHVQLVADGEGDSAVAIHTADVDELAVEVVPLPNVFLRHRREDPAEHVVVPSCCRRSADGPKRALDDLNVRPHVPAESLLRQARQLNAAGQGVHRAASQQGLEQVKKLGV
jgi:hypothetical protein